MKYFYIEPEVAGGWGSGTEADTSVHPPRVAKLHYEFSGWMGDELLESFPCYIATSEVAKSLEASGMKGFTVNTVQVTKSQEFFDLYGDRPLPDFVWLYIVGRAGNDDLGIAEDHRLVASDAALEVLRLYKLDHAVVESYSN